MAVLKRLLKEPLLQFLFLGALIFAADALLNDRTAGLNGDHYRIRVTSQHMDAMRTVFRNEHGRLPTDTELQVSLEQWLEEQMLYRQGLALGLEERDVIVRRQLVQKMRFLIEDALPVKEPDEEALQAWLDEHPERYGRGPTVSLQQVFISRGRHGEESESKAVELLERLRQAPESFEALGDKAAVGGIVQDADVERLRRDFGQSFARAVHALPDNEWHGPIRSGLGLHLVRITERAEFAAASLEDVRDRVRNDLRLYQREQANREAMQRLRERFRIEYEVPPNTGAGG